MENRNGLVAAAEATLATGTAEREGRITTAPDASRPTTLDVLAKVDAKDRNIHTPSSS